MALALVIAADEDRLWDELLAGSSGESADDEESILVAVAVDPLGRSARTRIGPQRLPVARPEREAFGGKVASSSKVVLL